MHMGPESGAEDTDYVQRGLKEVARGTSQLVLVRSIQSLNTNVDDNDEDKVQEIQRPEGRDQQRNDVGSIMDDSDTEEVENVFVEDNGTPMDNLVDDARKKVEAPPR
ncbi:hypothetical protein Tco_0115101 [Tanacetum coccineum]